MLVLVWACNDHSLETPTPSPSGTDTNYFDQNLNNDLDILFLVDDSLSMAPIQTKLVQNFPVFINVLESLPAGLPNVHIAVTTSSMGAGAFTSQVQGCTTPDLGNFVYQPRASTNPLCATAQITDGRHFIESMNNNTQNNFSGDITDVFSCIAQVGQNGCGFEHQLAAVRAALGDPTMGQAAPSGNDGFLRDDAYLAIIWITNEDDCSAPPDSQLFDPSQMSVTDPLGPLVSYRCTRFGILCDGQMPPMMATGPLQNCVSNDMLAQADEKHSLIPIEFFIDYFRRVKSSPNRVIAASVAAPPMPFSVFLDGGTGFPTLQHSCLAQDGSYGDPAVRLSQVIDSFGARGTQTNICDASFAGAMQVIAQTIGRVLGRQCIDGVLAAAPDFKQPIATPADGAVVDPKAVSCTVEDVQDLGTPQQKELRTLPSCNPMGQPSGACWALVGDGQCKVSGTKLAVCRNGFDPTNAMKPCPDGGTVEPDVTAVVHCATIP